MSKRRNQEPPALAMTLKPRETSAEFKRAPVQQALGLPATHVGVIKQAGGKSPTGPRSQQYPQQQQQQQQQARILNKRAPVQQPSSSSSGVGGLGSASNPTASVGVSATPPVDADAPYSLEAALLKLVEGNFYPSSENPRSSPGASSHHIFEGASLVDEQLSKLYEAGDVPTTNCLILGWSGRYQVSPSLHSWVQRQNGGAGGGRGVGSDNKPLRNVKRKMATNNTNDLAALGDSNQSDFSEFSVSPKATTSICTSTMQFCGPCSGTTLLTVDTDVRTPPLVVNTLLTLADSLVCLLPWSDYSSIIPKGGSVVTGPCPPTVWMNRVKDLLLKATATTLRPHSPMLLVLCYRSEQEKIEAFDYNGPDAEEAEARAEFLRVTVSDVLGRFISCSTRPRWAVSECVFHNLGSTSAIGEIDDEGGEKECLAFCPELYSTCIRGVQPSSLRHFVGTLRETWEESEGKILYNH